MVRRLVEHQEVDTPGGKRSQLRPGALAWRERGGWTSGGVRIEAELCQLRAGRPRGESRRHLEGLDEGRGPVQHTAVLGQLAHNDTRTEPPGPRRHRQTTEQRLDQGRLARSVRADERHPLRPADVEGERSEGELSALHDDVLEPGDHSSGATGLIDAEPQVPPLPWLLHDLERLEGAFGPAGTCGQLLGSIDAEVPLGLVVVSWLASLATHARRRPLALPLGPRPQLRPLCLVLCVGLFGVAALGFPLRLISGPTAAMNVSRAGVLVELHHLCHGAVEEGPVVRDEDETSTAVGHHVLEARQPVEIEVVGRFVEKGDVEASQKDGGQRGPCPLSSGKGCGGKVGAGRREADLIERRGEASLEVARSKRLVPGQGSA